MFFWDDTALVGTPQAIAEAVIIIQNLSSETGLYLKWKKCHLYGTSASIDKSRAKFAEGFSAGITCHKNFDIVYLKAPIGSDHFVKTWLENKLKDLGKVIQSVARMPYAHEACTLLRSCTAECRVVYLMRILPPRQMTSFLMEFDRLLKEGFEKILGIPLPEKWWRLAQLPPKFGGLAIRSGLRTHGAHHLTSLAKTATDVRRIIPTYDIQAVAEGGTKAWFNRVYESRVDLNQIIMSIQSAEHKQTWEANTSANIKNQLSTAQFCE